MNWILWWISIKVTGRIDAVGVDVSYINALTANKLTIMAINYTDPWVIDEIYSDTQKKNVKGILATFGTTTDALLDIVTGKFKPTGKCPSRRLSLKQPPSSERRCAGVSGWCCLPAFQVQRRHELIEKPAKRPDSHFAGY